jgi:hypothetical protein
MNQRYRLIFEEEIKRDIIRKIVEEKKRSNNLEQLLINESTRTELERGTVTGAEVASGHRAGTISSWLSWATYEDCHISTSLKFNPLYFRPDLIISNISCATLLF